MSKIVKNIIIAGLILTTLIVIFSPDSFMFLKISIHAEKFMFLMLLLILIFLIGREQKLMITSVLCAAALALFLKSNFRDPLVKAEPIEQTDLLLSVMHINLGKAEGHYNDLIADLKTRNVDVISFQEVTPTWHQFLSQGLEAYFDYQSFNPHIDIQGQGILSKYEFEKLEVKNNQHNIFSEYTIKAANKEIDFSSVYLYPPLNKAAYKSVNDFLDTIKLELENIRNPTFCLGEFSLVPWSKEIQELKAKCHLKDSRTDYTSAGAENWDMFEHVPVDYIFFNNAKCVKYRPLYLGGNRIGVEGIYKIN